MKLFSQKFTATAIALTLSLSILGCETQREARGYRFDEDRLAQIEEGKSTQDDVQQIMGSPSSQSTFAQLENTWYYIETKTIYFAFFKETPRAQRVLAVVFNPDGVVQELREYNLGDSYSVSPVSRETPTRGKELGVLEQFFGNLGRFNAKKGAPGQGAGGDN